MTPATRSTASRAHAAFAVTAALCLLAFAWMISLGTFARVADDTFGNFYDYQASAWLHGRWDVPEPALSGEAFVVGGKVYGYFGPTPALLRLPLVAMGIGFGQVTRVFMLFDYAACLLAAYALLSLAARWRDATATPRAASVILLIATAGLGSTLFFLGSRAYVYHEAILCGAAFALWSSYCSLRYLQLPASRWWSGALICGVLAVQARAPIGLFALSLLGVVALRLAFVRDGAGSRGGGGGGRPRPTSSNPCRAGSPDPAVTEIGQTPGAGSPGPAATNPAALPLRRARCHPFAVALLAALGVFSFNGVSYIKFGTFEGCPLRYNVQYTPEQLAALGDRNFHLGNLRFNSDAYLFRPSFSLQPHFPYIFREYLDRRLYPESRMAYRDPTTGMPWSMPGLFALATAGGLIAAFAAPHLRQPLALLGLAALPAALAMLTAVAVTQRYTADFVPVLIASAAFALAAFADLGSRSRHVVNGFSALLVAAGMAVTFAFTLYHQRTIVWGVPEVAQQQYQRWCQRVDAFFGTAR